MVWSDWLGKDTEKHCSLSPQRASPSQGQLGIDQSRKLSAGREKKKSKSMMREP